MNGFGGLGMPPGSFKIKNALKFYGKITNLMQIFKKEVFEVDVIGATRNFLILISDGEHEYICRHPWINVSSFLYIFH